MRLWLGPEATGGPESRVAVQGPEIYAEERPAVIAFPSPGKSVGDADRPIYPTSLFEVKGRGGPAGRPESRIIRAHYAAFTEHHVIFYLASDGPGGDVLVTALKAMNVVTIENVTDK